MHLHPLVADRWNIVLFQLRASVFRCQPVDDPFHDDLVNYNKAVALYQTLREISGKHYISMQAGCDMRGQLIIAVPVQNIV